MGTTNHRPMELVLYLCHCCSKAKKYIYIVRVFVEKAVPMALLTGLVYPQALLRVSRVGNGYQSMGHSALQMRGQH